MAQRKSGADPDEYEQDLPDSTPSGAVAYDGPTVEAPVETRADWWDGDLTTVRVATPTEPTTMTVSWLSDAERKEIIAAQQGTPEPAAAKPTTKSKAKSDGGSSGSSGK
jgi:hypothetical protein